MSRGGFFPLPLRRAMILPCLGSRPTISAGMPSFSRMAFRNSAARTSLPGGLVVSIWTNCLSVATTSACAAAKSGAGGAANAGTVSARSAARVRYMGGVRKQLGPGQFQRGAAEAQTLRLVLWV